MADKPAQAQQTSRFGFLGRKLGPAPIWLWAVIIIVLYYLYQHFFGSGSASAAPADSTPAAGGATTIKQTVTETIRRVARKPGKTKRKPPKKRKPGKRDGNVQPGGVVAGGVTSAPEDGAVRGNPDTKTPARRKPTPTAAPVKVTAPTSRSTTTSVTSGTPTGQPEQVSGGGPGVVYEGPVYGLWTTEQQGVQAFDSAQGGTSVDVTAA